MKRINFLPWISQGRNECGKYLFFCADRKGQAIEKDEQIVFSLEFSLESFKTLESMRRLLTLIFLQETMAEISVHCDEKNHLWMNQNLQKKSSDQEWNAKVLQQIWTMEFFETQLKSNEMPHRQQRGTYELLG